MPSLAPELALREADDPTAPVPPAQPEPAATAAELRATAQAARQALAQVLKDRAALFNATDADLAKLVDEALARIVVVLSGQPSDYQLWVLPRLVDSIRRIADQLATEAGDKAGAAMGRAWTLGARAVDAPVAASGAAANTAPDTTPGLGTASAAQLRALRVMTTSQIGGATSAAVTSINRELGQVVLGVQAPFDAQRKIGALLTDRTASQLRAIIHLSLGQAFNTASFEKLQAQAARDPKIKKMWRRSGKLHARWNHDAIDGTVEDVGKPFYVQPGNRKGGPVALMYPADPAAPVGETINCGCVLIPWKATWGMLYKGAKPYTAAERAARGLGAKPAAAVKQTLTAAQTKTSQAKALAAFGATLDKPASLRDVTGQTVVVDARLVGPGAAPAALTAGKQDLAAYWTVQALRRPTEVWQSERVDLATGEVLRQREVVKRFAAAGRQWLATAELRPEGGRWVGAKPVTITPAPPAGPQLRNGVRVWPRRG